MNKILILYLVCFVCSCSNRREERPLFAPIEGKKDIKYDSLSFSFFYLDSLELMSPVGYLQMMDSEILFLERETGLLRIYDTLGRFKEKKMGFGRAKNEIMGSDITNFGLGTNSKEYLIFDDLCYFVFDSNYVLKTRGTMESQVHTTPSRKVHGNNPGIYTWSYRNPVVKMYNDVIYMNVNISSRIDLFDEKERFFGEGRTLTMIDQKTGKLDKIFARYPEIYLQHDLQAFYTSRFDIDANGFLYMSYEADSLIYQYNQELQQIKTFGFSGSNMTRNFRKIRSEDIVKARQENGFYEQIKCCDNEILLRLYKRGVGDTIHDGLQIYKGTDLVGDVSVPKDFRMIGVYHNSVYFYRECEQASTIIVAKADLDFK
ncbi:MAG: hypothetical protein RR259_11215 [Odoribacter sp.]